MDNSALDVPTADDSKTPPAGDFSASVAGHPYATFIESVTKPARYIGGEHGERKKPWQSVQARFCLAFPDIYDIGMSHLGYRILYKLINDDPALLAERCYAPWSDMQAKLLEKGEFLRSLESARPLSDFDVVGFSLQFELTYTNVLNMLQLGGIPLRSEHRNDADPLIVAGGPVATHAEPLAPFIDAFAIGDAEELAVEIAHSWARSKREGLSRREALRRLARLQGIYVPSLYRVAPDPETGIEVVVAPLDDEAPALPIQRRLVPDLSKFPFPDDGPVGGPEAIFDRVSIEVARGCTEGCRFCQAGMIYRPVRERKPEEVVSTVLRALEKTGHDEVSLTALSTADVSCISPLIKKLAEETAPRRVSLSVASLRAYGVANDLLDEMRRVRVSGLTFAPEAGTQRMRDVINKNVTEEQLLQTAERVFSKGFDSMKLYFIIGLPTEEDEDVRGIMQVGKNALAVARRLKRHRAKVTVSVSTHVPKPHTPFQWCAMDSGDEVRRKQAILKAELGRERGITLRCHDSAGSQLEGVFARGDRRLGDVLERAYLRGATFDSWEEKLRLDVWEEAFAFYGIEPAKYLGTLPLSARLPWDHFDIGLEPYFLQREYQKALKNRLSPPCGKAAGMFIHHTNVSDANADQRRLVCYDCGVACDMGKMRSERISFLASMGALEPAPVRRLPVLGAASADGEAASATEVAERGAPDELELTLAETRANERSPELERPPQPGERHERWRLSFEKLGASALLGHLDFMREIGRVIRRAGLRPVYSQGFSPKPRFTFGPALALGVASLDEKIEVDLIDAPGAEPMLAMLQRASGAGLRFTRAERLERGAPSLGSAVNGARYIILFASTLSLDATHLEAKIAEFVQRDRSVIKRTVKGIGRLIDVKSRTRSIRIGDAKTRERIAAAGFVGRFSSIVVDVEIGPEGSVKPSEIVEALLGDGEVPHQVIRDVLLLGPATSTKPDSSEISGSVVSASAVS
ncbi:MAG TPA: TIGR03960 family B12-binding radical SAM protein [Polyangiaceae bacterium]|nr:TIGR03960 family B12-binding radical SAM protein [Polyangiaceae bacterium]